MLQQDQRHLATETAAQGPLGWGYSSQCLRTQRTTGLCRMGDQQSWHSMVWGSPSRYLEAMGLPLPFEQHGPVLAAGLVHLLHGPRLPLRPVELPLAHSCRKGAPDPAQLQDLSERPSVPTPVPIRALSPVPHHTFTLLPSRCAEPTLPSFSSSQKILWVGRSRASAVGQPSPWASSMCRRLPSILASISRAWLPTSDQYISLVGREVQAYGLDTALSQQQGSPEKQP